MHALQTYNNQFEYDNALPPEDHAADSLETECTIFAERFTDNQMDAETFFDLAEAFGSETIGDYLAEDDQHNLLQLVLAARKAGVFDAYTKPVIARLYAAAYKHKEQEYGQQ